MSELRRWDVELGCAGYFGFGGGYAKAQGVDYARNAIACNVCPMATECWARHKARVAQLIPLSTEAFEAMARETTGPELLRRWWERFHAPDPYSAVMLGNIQDGFAVGGGDKPLDRGEFTLAWPLERVG